MTMTITDFSITFKDEIGFPENAPFLTSLKEVEMQFEIISLESLKNFYQSTP